MILKMKWNVLEKNTIQEDILSEMWKRKFHAVMADEVTSYKKNIVIMYAICWYWKNIGEECIEFLTLERITGEELAKSLGEIY